jgi:hypothetical protein
MTNSTKGTKTLPELERELAEAETKYAEAVACEPFVNACRSLRQAAASHSAATAVVASTRDAYQRAEAAGAPADLVERARRVSQGLPTLDDLRLVILPSKKKEPSPGTLRILAELADSEGQESRSRNELSIAVDRFTEQAGKARALARATLAARKALELSRRGIDPATAGGDDPELDELALALVLEHPEVEGLEDFLHRT